MDNWKYGEIMNNYGPGWWIDPLGFGPMARDYAYHIVHCTITHYYATSPFRRSPLGILSIPLAIIRHNQIRQLLVEYCIYK